MDRIWKMVIALMMISLQALPQIRIKDSITIVPSVLHSQSVKRLKGATSCIKTIVSMNYSQIHIAQPIIEISYPGGTDRILNCATGYGGYYQKEYFGVPADYGMSVNSCIQNIEIPQVEIKEVSPIQGELSRFDIWFKFSTSPCGGCPLNILVGNLISLPTESAPSPTIELTILCSDSTRNASIENPFIISSNYLPIFVLSEVHISGNDCYPSNAPIITWECPDTINISDFYDAVGDSFVIPISAQQYATFPNGTPDILQIACKVNIEDPYGSSSNDPKYLHFELKDGCPFITSIVTSINNNETEKKIPIFVKKKLKHGGVTNYPENTLFDFSILDGMSYAKLEDLSGQTSNQFFSVTNPIYLLPDTSNHLPSAKVEVKGVPSQLQYLGGRANKMNVIDACQITTEFEILGLNHLEIIVLSDDLAYSESVPIYVKGKNVKGEDYDLPLNEYINLSVSEGQDYGALITPEGDTLFQGNTVYSASVGQLMECNTLFGAVKKNPVIGELVTISAKLESNQNVAGEYIANVQEQTIRLVTLNSVFPTVKPVYDLITPENQLNLEVGVTRAGIPQSNHPFSISIKTILNSGGHEHQHHHPIEENNQIESGSILIDESIVPFPIIRETSENGRKSFLYQASKFGDIKQIRVTSSYSNLLFDTLSVFEKVQDLILLPNGEHYLKIGGNDKHHGPPNRPNEDNNHWATRTIIDAVTAIADSFQLVYPNYLLRINDMSLPYGGAFDIDGHWGTLERHKGHARGLNADVSYDIVSANNLTLTSTLSSRAKNVLYDIISHFYKAPRPEDGHYHIQ